MLINPECVAEAPSRRVATASSRSLAEFGLGAVVHVRGRADAAAGAARMSGIWGCSGNAAAGYLPDPGSAVQGGRLANGPVQPKTLQVSVITKSTVQNSTYQHNNIQVTRLVPATGGGVGPHPGREPGPA